LKLGARPFRAEADRRAWARVEWVEDAGFSAKSMKRPGLASILARIERGDVLVSAKLDRLSRSLLDFDGLMQRASAVAGRWSPWTHRLTALQRQAKP